MSNLKVVMSVILSVPEQIVLKALHSVRRQKHVGCHLAKSALAYVHASKARILCISAHTHIHNATIEKQCKMYVKTSRLVGHKLCMSIMNIQETSQDKTQCTARLETIAQLFSQCCCMENDAAAALCMLLRPAI